MSGILSCGDCRAAGTAPVPALERRAGVRKFAYAQPSRLTVVNLSDPREEQSVNSSSIARLTALAVLAIAGVPGVATSQRPDEAVIRTALNARLATFAQAIKAKDVAAVGDMFTEDGTWILPDASTYTGRAAITAAASGQFETFESFVFDQMTIARLVVVSDSEAVTFVHGTYTLTETGKAPVKRVNPVADLWRRGADGVWRVSYELNADGPAPSATGTTP